MKQLRYVEVGLRESLSSIPAYLVSPLALFATLPLLLAAASVPVFGSCFARPARSGFVPSFDFSPWLRTNSPAIGDTEPARRGPRLVF